MNTTPTQPTAEQASDPYNLSDLLMLRRLEDTAMQAAAMQQAVVGESDGTYHAFMSAARLAKDTIESHSTSDQRAAIEVTLQADYKAMGANQRAMHTKIRKKVKAVADKLKAKAKAAAEKAKVDKAKAAAKAKEPAKTADPRPARKKAAAPKPAS
jgi:membrane protein involved in colicin uptake